MGLGCSNHNNNNKRAINIECSACIKALGTTQFLSVHQDYLQDLYCVTKMALQPPPYPTRILDQNFGMCITPQDLIFPSNNLSTPNYYRPWKWYMQNVTKEYASTIENEKNKFQITLDVQHFKPNEISVKVVNHEVLIEGKHEERLDEHGIVSRQFTRRYDLPNDCNPEDVSSTLSSDGVLMVVSNKKAMKDAFNERSVPIKLCESFAKRQELQSSQVSAETAMKTTAQTSTDTKKENMKSDAKNKNKSLILKEEHSCLLKPELLMENALSKDKITETKIETEELFKMSGDKVGQSVSSMTSSSDEMIKMSMDKIGSSMGIAASSTEFEMSSEKAGKSSIAEALSAEFGLSAIQMGKSNMAASSEMSSFQSSESSKMEESSSSFMSSITSSLKSSELFSDTISATLKEAADNM